VWGHWEDVAKMARRAARSRAEISPWEVLQGSSSLWLGLPLLLAVALSLLAHAAHDFYGTYMASELGGVELLQAVVIAGAAVLAAVTLAQPAVRRRPWLAAWLLLAVAGCVYTAGEEVSWGQHLFAWATPEPWQQFNDQGETNLHNVSAWFDQKPRLILQIAILVGALALPLLRHTRLYPRNPRIAYLMPSLRCVPSAAMVAVIQVEGAVLDLMDGGLLLYYRPSEVQELFIYVTVAIYLTDLMLRIRRHTPPA